MGSAALLGPPQTAYVASFPSVCLGSQYSNTAGESGDWGIRGPLSGEIPVSEWLPAYIFLPPITPKASRAPHRVSVSSWG